MYIYIDTFQLLLTMQSIISSNIRETLAGIYVPSEKNCDVWEILSSAPCNAVLRVNTLKTCTDDAIYTLNSYLQLHCDGVKYDVTQHPLLDDVLIVTPNSFGSTLEQFDKEAIVDVHCGAAVLRGAHVFAPGVLAATADVKANDIVSVYADLERKCCRGYTKRFTGSKMFLGNGKCLYDRHGYFEKNIQLEGVAIQMLSTKSMLPSFSNLDLGLFYPQNLPSAVVAHVCDLSTTVLDMCAAPGGKTTHIASRMRNKGVVVAIDKSERKVEKIHENCKRLGLTNVRCFTYNSTKLLSTQPVSSELISPPFPASSFEAILLDPPCSGIGQRPQLRCVMSDKELHSFPVYQKKLIKQAVPLLKPGGCLVYSTCTLLPQENEQQVSWALKTFPELELVAQQPTVGRPGILGYGLTADNCSKVQRFDRSYLSGISRDHDTIGFFIAKFRKSF